MAILPGFLLLASLVLASCDGSAYRRPYQPPEVDTLNGTIHVRNGPVGAWTPSEEWIVKEQFRIGEAGFEFDEELGDSDVLFQNVLLGPSLGPDGNIWVVEYPDDRISVFSGDGKSLVRQFGRSGRGPGELSGPTGVGVDPFGRAWVAEPFSGRWSVFDSVGRFEKTVPLRVQGLYVSRRLHPVWLEQANRITTELRDRRSVRLVSFDSTGSVLRKSPSVRFREIPSVPISTRDPDQRRFLSTRIERVRWAFARNMSVWFAYSGELKLYQVSLETGDTLRVVETTHRDEWALTASEREQLERILERSGTSPDRFPLVRPIIDGVHVTDDGHVLVQIIEEPGSETSLWDVFSREGIFLGEVRTSFAVPRHQTGLVTVVGDTLLAVTQGDWDEPYVVRATIQRGARD